MDFKSETNCWKPAVWTLAVLVAIMAMAALFGGFDPNAVASR